MRMNILEKMIDVRSNSLSEAEIRQLRLFSTNKTNAIVALLHIWFTLIFGDHISASSTKAHLTSCSEWGLQAQSGKTSPAFGLLGKFNQLYILTEQWRPRLLSVCNLGTYKTHDHLLHLINAGGVRAPGVGQRFSNYERGRRVARGLWRERHEAKILFAGVVEITGS